MEIRYDAVKGEIQTIGLNDSSDVVALGFLSSSLSTCFPFSVWQDGRKTYSRGSTYAVIHNSY